MFPLKVLYLIPSLEIGGTEKQLLLLLRELNRVQKKKSFLHVEVFALKTFGPLKSQIDQLGIKIHDGSFQNPWFLRGKIGSFFGAFCQLWRVIKIFQPDILHAFLPVPNFLAAVMRFFYPSLKIITSKRALNTHQDRYPLWALFDRLANRLSHCIVVNSQAVYQDTLKRDQPNSRKIQCIYNGLDLNPFQAASLERLQNRKMLGLDPYQLGIIIVGNFYLYKGHHDFLQAIANPSFLGQNCVDMKIFFAGEDKGQESVLKQQIKNLKLTVTFLGSREDIPQLLSAMDIFVLPSHEEGFSNALLEAMAAKLAIIATAVGGNAEALCNGSLGLLVPPKNPEMLQQALVKLIGDPTLRTKLGQKASEYVNQNFSIFCMAEKYINLYQSL